MIAAMDVVPGRACRLDAVAGSAGCFSCCMSQPIGLRPGFTGPGPRRSSCSAPVYQMRAEVAAKFSRMPLSYFDTSREASCSAVTTTSTTVASPCNRR
jgi:hypothetical protein